MPGKFQNINFDLDKLPAMPVVAAQIINLLNDPDVSTNNLVEVVGKDPAVAAQVLKIANSSFYSMSRQVTTLNMAIVVLGETALKNLVLAASMRGIHKSFGNIEQTLWEDSMVCALGSRFLAFKLQLANPEEAFLAGLFRHVGKSILNNQDEDYKKIFSKMITSAVTNQSETELKIFGATHAQIGAAVLENWRLNESFSQVALHHSDVEITDIDNQNTIKLVCLVNIASAFPAIFGIFGQPRKIDLGDLAGAKVLNIGAEKLLNVQNEFQIIFEENREKFLA